VAGWVESCIRWGSRSPKIRGNILRGNRAAQFNVGLHTDNVAQALIPVQHSGDAASSQITLGFLVHRNVL